AVEEGIVAGGGVALLRAQSRLDGLEESLPEDQAAGVRIVRRAIEEPLRWIAGNAGIDGSIVVQKVKDGRGAFGFNAAIARLYAFTNTLAKSTAGTEARRTAARTLAQLMSPMTPHLSEEIWSLLGGEGLIAAAPWPVAEESMLIDDTVVLPIQINGKRRAEISVPREIDKAELEKIVLAHDAVVKALEGAAPKKLVIVPGRIVNVVI
ncbi:MAG: class I tRNA ligase family protein, partial [Paracoccaceae bacterium]|nr:class I tRNA ligase family protein [Paracoccaceae bacterium]